MGGGNATLPKGTTAPVERQEIVSLQRERGERKGEREERDLRDGFYVICPHCVEFSLSVQEGGAI